MIDFKKALSPCYIVDEEKLRSNLSIIKNIADKAGVEIILALKANAMWKLFPIIREYVHGTTASSINEARLAYEEFGKNVYTYAPIYKENEIEEIANYSKHIIFNSISQYERHRQLVQQKNISCGLRVNPGYSPVEKDIYNPCSSGSRLGIPKEQLKELPQGIDGLLFHALCESNSNDLAHALKVFKENFSHILPHIKWLDMGGGHLITHKDYNCDDLISILTQFKQEYQHIKIIMEPGSAFTWQTGCLVSTIEDIIENNGVSTLILDVSFTCHMPDCLEMPYKPSVIGAHNPKQGEKKWRLGGNSCLAGDFMGDYAFDNEPQIGNRVVFEDMIHYTTVKTTMFNGVAHPSIAIAESNGNIKVLKNFNYEDYKNRMS